MAYPPKVLSKPEGTVESEGLRGSKVIQIEGIDKLPLHKRQERKPVKSAEPPQSVAKPVDNTKPNDPTPPQQSTRVTGPIEIWPIPIECNPSKPTTKIQIVCIGGQKQMVKVNLTTTVLELYGHVKALSHCVLWFMFLVKKNEDFVGCSESHGF